MYASKYNTGLNTKVLTKEFEVYDNTTEAAIQINESKARLIYNKYVKSINGATIISFFSAFLSCLTTLFTATFNDILGIKGSSYFIAYTFILLAIIFGLLTVVFFIKWIINKNKLNEAEFIKELKGETDRYLKHYNTKP